MCHNDLLGELLTLLMRRYRQSPTTADHPNLSFPNMQRICKSRPGKAVGFPDMKGDELHVIYFDVWSNQTSNGFLRSTENRMEEIQRIVGLRQNDH